MVDHLVFYVIHPYVIYCSGSPSCGTIFLKLAPKFNCTIREGSIVFINVLNSKRQSYQCYKTIINWVVAKFAHLFHFVKFVDAPFPAPTFYWCVLTTEMSHYSTAAHTFCKLLWVKLTRKCTSMSKLERGWWENWRGALI